MKRRSMYLVGTALACVLVAGTAVLRDSTNASHDQAQATGGADALKVVKDKETGQLRAATAKEAADLRKLEDKANRKLNPDYLEAAGVTQQHSDGSASMVVDLSNLETVTATVNEDGSVTLMHGDHEIPAAADEWPEE